VITCSAPRALTAAEWSAFPKSIGAQGISNYADLAESANCDRRHNRTHGPSAPNRDDGKAENRSRSSFDRYEFDPPLNLLRQPFDES
jgi:hypothetical protein